MRKDKHAREELRVFHAFALRCGLPITPSSIEIRPPGEPDILCEVRGEGAVGFELARLVDENNIAKRHADQYRLSLSVRSYHRSLFDSTQRELERLYGNALVSIGFRPTERVLRCERAIKELFDLLLEQDPAFEGRLLQPRKRAPLYSIDVIRRDGLHGPHFRVEAGGSYAPLPLNIIAKKLRKSYETAAPIELLAYYGLEPPPVSQEAVECARTQLNAIVDEMLSQSPFRRIWLFDAASLKVEFDGRVGGSGSVMSR